MKALLATLKWVGLGLLILIVLFVIFVFARANRTYEAPYPAITASQDSAVIARGAYIVNGAGHCADCHFAVSELARVGRGEQVPLSGGFSFPSPIGTIYAPNITSDKETGIGDYTDGEIARTLRYGVKKNGHALIDFMSLYDASDEDITAVISYLRTLPPVKTLRKENEWNFMGNAIRAAGLIKPMGDGDVPPAPPVDSTAAYGRYLASSIANCVGCHTNFDMMTGEKIGVDFAGQMPMEVFDAQGAIVAGKHVVTPNLTPDPETGRMANWTQDMFITRFRAGRVIEGTPMPWGSFSRMSDLELTALYKFFNSLEPVNAPAPVGVQEGDPPA